MKRLAPVAALLATLLLVGCSTPSQEQVYHLTVLHTNDHHGRFWRNERGEYGMAARKTVIDGIRREVASQGGYTLLLDGGDINTGVPESDLQNALPDFIGMNLLGYQAMTVGNHEFDKSQHVLDMQRALINFPMLSANIYRQGQRMFQPYALFTFGGLRVGVLGLTTEDTRKLVSPQRVKDIEFHDPIAEAAKLVPELRSQADVVIATSHMGHYEDGRHGSQAPGDVEMARKVNGIDLIIGGHSQDAACMLADNVRDPAYEPGKPCRPDRQNGTWIVQAHEWGKYVGRADFEYRDGQLRLEKYRLIPINLKQAVKDADGKTRYRSASPEIAEDPDMLALLSPFQAYGQQKLATPIGSSDELLEGGRDVVRHRQAAMGVLLGRAMLARSGADFAIINSGSIRDSLRAGSITRKDILKALPFGSTLVSVELSGKEVMDYLNAAARMTPGSGGFPQFAGIELEITNGQIKKARIKGREIEAERSYRIALNSFQAAGADQYPELASHKSFVNTGITDADVLSEFIAAHSPLRASDYAPEQSVVRN